MNKIVGLIALLCFVGIANAVEIIPVLEPIDSRHPIEPAPPLPPQPPVEPPRDIWPEFEKPIHNEFMHFARQCKLGSCTHAVYVNEGGNDTNPCTQREPCESVQRGLNIVCPLAVNGTFYAVMLETGTYNKGNITACANVAVIGPDSRFTQLKLSITADKKLGHIGFPTTGINSDPGQGSMFAFIGVFINKSDTHAATVYMDLSYATVANNGFWNDVIFAVPVTLISNKFGGLTNFLINCPSHALMIIIGGITQVFGHITQFFASIWVYVSGVTKINFVGSTFTSGTAVNNLVLYGDQLSNLQATFGWVTWGTTAQFIVNGLCKLSGTNLPVKSRTVLNGNKFINTVDATSIGINLDTPGYWAGSPTTVDAIIAQIEPSATTTIKALVAPPMSVVGTTAGAIAITSAIASVRGPAVFVTGAGTVNAPLTLTRNILSLIVPIPGPAGGISTQTVTTAINTPATGGFATLAPSGGQPILGTITINTPTSVLINFWIPTGTAVSTGTPLSWGYSASLN